MIYGDRSLTREKQHHHEQNDKKGDSSMKKIILCLVLVLLMGFPFWTDARGQDVQKQDVKIKMERLSGALKPSAKQKVVRAAHAIKGQIFASKGKVDVRAVAASSVKKQFGTLPPRDMDALISLVMFELVKSQEQDLKEMANEMQKMNRVKEQQRNYINQLNKRKAAMKDQLKEQIKKGVAPPLVQKQVAVQKIQVQTAKTRSLNIPYTKTPVLPVPKDPVKMSNSEVQTEILAAEARLKILQDMSQLDQLSLQDAMQKQQQMIQTISNVMKTQQDTSQAIIRNIK